MSRMKGETIIRKITEGSYDNDLETINSVVVARMKIVRREEGLKTVGKLKRGDRVVTKNLRPKYMNGLMAKVVSINGEKVLIEIEPDQYTGRYMKRSPVAGNCVEKA